MRLWSCFRVVMTPIEVEIMLIRSKTCCFIGHRRLPQEKLGSIAGNLACEIDRLIDMGVTDYVSGGALGFDLLAADLILAKRDAGRNIRLIFALPCKTQSRFWTDEQKQRYRRILGQADEIRYVAEDYAPDCMKKRNQYMVDQSAYCICALINPSSGTGQTVRYAERQGLTVIRV